MRLALIAAGMALSLAACGNNDQRDNTMNVDENLTAENIVSNDVTAIDAVTADAANMAADVNYEMPVDNNTEVASNSSMPASPSKPRPKSSAPVRGSDTPSGNAVANSASNTGE